MSGFWIRVDANIRRRKVVWRLVVSHGLSADAAVGVLVQLWGAVAQHAPGGDISAVPDALLEEWVQWSGEPGAFAKWVRSEHATDGIINEWEEYAGALEQRRERDRARKVQSRSRGQSADIPRDVLVTSSRNGTERNGTVLQSSSPAELQSTPEYSLSSSALAELLGETLLEPHAIEVLTTFIDQRPASVSAEKLVALLRGWRHGLGMIAGKACTPQQLVAGLADYLATSNRDYNPKHLRSFVAREMAPPHANGSPRKSAGAQSYDNALAALETP